MKGFARRQRCYSIFVNYSRIHCGVNVRKGEYFMSNNVIHIKDLTEILEIDELSAAELLSGDIDFEVCELHKIASRKCMAVSELTSMLKTSYPEAV
jgi:hypothetical protein